MKDKFKRDIDYLRISLTDKCNLRCIYCMDENQQDFIQEEKKLTNSEIYRIVKEASELGIKKIRLTGGEPLVRKNVIDLISSLNSIDKIEEIYLTTNGTLLGESIKELSRNGVKGVNISLDSLKEDRFKQLTRRNRLNEVLNSIDQCLKYGIKVKINTVIINEINKDEILDFINLTIEKKVDVRFIELMPIGAAKEYSGTSNEEIISIIKSKYSEFEFISREKSSGPAKYLKVKGAKGKVGFISAMSNCFCEECNRIRLTSEGFLKQCLHFNYGVDLRELLREGISDERLRNIIKDTIYDKPEKHLFGVNSKDKDIRYMNQIGG